MSSRWTQQRSDPRMMQDVADHWGLAVVMGVVSIILGVLAMFYPGATS